MDLFRPSPFSSRNISALINFKVVICQCAKVDKSDRKIISNGQEEDEESSLLYPLPSFPHISNPSLRCLMFTNGKAITSNGQFHTQFIIYIFRLTSKYYTQMIYIEREVLVDE